MAFFDKFPYTNFQELNLDRIIEYINSIKPILDGIRKEIEDFGPKMQEYVNTWLEEHPEVTTTVEDGSISFAKLTNEVADAVGDYDGITVKFHHLESNVDTSYVLLKIPKAIYQVSYDNCSGNENDSPVVLQSDPVQWLKHHPDYDLASNCNYGGYDYSGRLHGISHLGTNNNRPYLAHNSNTDEYLIYPEGTEIWDIPAGYDTVFAIDETLVINGEISQAIEATNYEPRNVFGWNDEYYIMMITEGRGTTEKGMNLSDAARIMVTEEAQTAVNFDGGGSICLAANMHGSVQKINKYRDQALGFPELRTVGVAQGFKRRAN